MIEFAIFVHMKKNVNKYETKLYRYIDDLYHMCRHKEIFSDSYFRKCERPDMKDKYCHGI